jgi:anti-anti-sigma regulatory factor
MEQEVAPEADRLAHAFVRDITKFGVVAYAFGELDLCVSADFEQFLLESAPYGRALIVDLSECRFIDASAVSALLRVRRRLGDRFHIVARPGCIAYRILEILGLAKDFGVQKRPLRLSP